MSLPKSKASALLTLFSRKHTGQHKLCTAGFQVMLSLNKISVRHATAAGVRPHRFQHATE